MNRVASPLRMLLMELIKQGAEMRSWVNARWINVTVAWQIRGMRKRKGWTQAQLAKAAGVSFQTINWIEKFHWGKRSPTAGLLIAIAAALDVALRINFTSWGELLDEMERSPVLPVAFADDTALVDGASTKP